MDINIDIFITLLFCGFKTIFDFKSKYFLKSPTLSLSFSDKLIFFMSVSLHHVPVLTMYIVM